MLMGRMGGRGAPPIAIPIAPRLEQSRRRAHLRSGQLLFFCEIPHAVPV
jgi:hypothetical protein